VTAVELLDDLADRGIRLTPEAGDRIRWRASQALPTPDDLDAIRAHRDELVALLAPPDNVIALPVAPPEPADPCGVCGGRSWHPPCRRAPSPWGAP